MTYLVQKRERVLVSGRVPKTARRLPHREAGPVQIVDRAGVRRDAIHTGMGDAGGEYVYMADAQLGGLSLKKIGKAIGKAAKDVGKVVAKAAPIVALATPFAPVALVAKGVQIADKLKSVKGVATAGQLLKTGQQVKKVAVAKGLIGSKRADGSTVMPNDADAVNIGPTPLSVGFTSRKSGTSAALQAQLDALNKAAIDKADFDTRAAAQKAAQDAEAKRLKQDAAKARLADRQKKQADEKAVKDAADAAKKIEDDKAAAEKKEKREQRRRDRDAQATADKQAQAERDDAARQAMLNAQGGAAAMQSSGGASGGGGGGVPAPAAYTGAPSDNATAPTDTAEPEATAATASPLQNPVVLIGLGAAALLLLSGGKSRR